ncbi:cytochrome-b5 reductase [Capronia epimyces CBS 606.96]|uniref:NADH-cytochrome b5 reductase n=1 Tax=Capronia epimyces CBS 606.96 TaxID=1182542 RepID=W9YJJ6_9EURO|nr:cytochrome-b5 reductase [Capronia epimyces CBS 606.96]EXJ89835.1 cytochrome-b5 reductase [Capronia epimyces CBS 606.96]
MFARSMLRSAGPLRQSIRSYSTEAPNKSSSTPWIVGAAAVGAGIAGYTLLGNNKVSADAPKPSDDAKYGAQKVGETSKAFTGGDQGFVDLKLAEVILYNHNTKRFKFELPEQDQVSGLSVASAVITKYQPPNADKPVIRPYTPINDEVDVKGYLELLVKVYPNGALSSHLDSMVPGQRLSFKGPIPKYPWSPNKHEHITLIAGGTGITPMYQLIRAIFKNPEDKTKVSLVYGNITEEDILLKKELEDIEKEFPQRFRAFYVLDQPPSSWPYGKGFISKELLKTIVPDPKSSNIKIFVCGPPGLYKAISGNKTSPQDQGELSGILKELGYTKDQVYKF